MNVTKILLIGAAAGAAVAIGGVIIAHAMKKKYSSYKLNPETKEMEPSEDDETEETLASRIKKAASEKVTEILAFVILHREQVEAVMTIVGLVGGVIGILNGIKDYKRKDAMEEMIREMHDHDISYEELWNMHMDQWDEFMNTCKGRHEDIMDILGHAEHLVVET